MIEAGRPYLVRPTKKIDQLIFNNVTIEADITAPMGSVTTGGLTFKGLFKPETLPAYSYYVNEKLYHTSESVATPMPAFRAYFYNDSIYQVPAKAMSFSVNGSMGEQVMTGIEEIFADPSANHGVSVESKTIYNLQGQAVRKNSTVMEGLPKGLYIVDGKKLLVK